MLFVFISLANVRQYFQFAKNLKEKYTFSFQIIIENGGMNDSLQRYGAKKDASEIKKPPHKTGWHPTKK